MQTGRLHPLTITITDIVTFFESKDFVVEAGPELEDEYHNFDALNVSRDHPSRDMQDTFWTREDPPRVLRTQTSSVQIRYMEKQMKKGVKPPYRIIAPGKVFRNEATDATHEAQFYQNEGLVVGKDVTMAHLKGTLNEFFRDFLGPEAKVRFRPSYFPFTKPSVEVDVWFAQGNGGDGAWLEVMGAGMVHPKVLSNVGIDPTVYRGFAFGGGIERLMMVKYGIPDVRLFHSGDIRFIHGFDSQKI